MSEKQRQSVYVVIDHSRELREQYVQHNSVTSVRLQVDVCRSNAHPVFCEQR